MSLNLQAVERNSLTDPYFLYRIFYWPHAQYDTSLLIQSILMVIIQLILLKVALDHRPPTPVKGEAGVPYAGDDDKIFGFKRPYEFWQWRSPRQYAHFGHE